MEDQLWWPSEAHRQSRCTHEDPGDSWKGQGRGEEGLKNVLPRLPPSHVPTLLLSTDSSPNSCMHSLHTHTYAVACLGAWVDEARRQLWKLSLRS